jgi:hypothetical protein
MSSSFNYMQWNYFMIKARYLSCHITLKNINKKKYYYIHKYIRGLSLSACRQKMNFTIRSSVEKIKFELLLKLQHPPITACSVDWSVIATRHTYMVFAIVLRCVSVFMYLPTIYLGKGCRKNNTKTCNNIARSEVPTAMILKILSWDVPPCTDASQTTRLLRGSCLLHSLVDPEDGGSTILPHIGKQTTPHHVAENTTLHCYIYLFICLCTLEFLNAF